MAIERCFIDVSMFHKWKRFVTADVTATVAKRANTA